MDNNDKKQMSLELRPEVARGTYSNLAIISHSPSEFIIDFAAMLPGMPKPDIGSRIIMNPEHAKRLFNALADNISKYEAQFGAISVKDPQPKGTLDLGEYLKNQGGGTRS